MKNTKKIFGILLILIISLLAVSCSSDKAKNAPKNVLEKVMQNKKLVVGTSADYPPYEFHAMIDGKDHIVGFDMELARAIAKEMGVEIEIKDIGFDAVLAGVGTGQIDIGVAGIGRRPDREEAMEFSDSYYQSYQTILVPEKMKDSYPDVESLKGAKIGAQIGSIQEKIAKSIEGAEVRSLGKFTDLILELKTGKIDALVSELPVGQSYVKQNPDLHVAKHLVFPDENEGSCVIAQKGETELIAEINKIIAKLKDEGKIDQFVADANKLVEDLGDQ